MLTRISIVISLITYILNLISNWKSNSNKWIKKITPITNILQVGCIFDILLLIFNSSISSMKILGLLYTIFFPLNILLKNEFSRIKNVAFQIILILISLFCVLNVESNTIENHFNQIKYFLVILQLAAIIFSFYNSFKHKVKLNEKNYFYFLILGFVILDFFYFLGYYEIIIFDTKTWISFFTYYLLYLNLLRIIYIIYVAKHL